MTTQKINTRFSRFGLFLCGLIVGLPSTVVASEGKPSVIHQAPICTKKSFEAPLREKAAPGKKATKTRLTLLATPCRPRALTLTSESGKSTTLNSVIERFSLIGHHVLVNVWATWCAPCIAEMPSLLKLQADSSLQTLGILSINQDINARTIVPMFLEKRGWETLETWFDLSRKTQSAFGVESVLPLSFVINPDGHVVAFVRGGVNLEDPAFKNSLRALMAQRTPAPTA